MLHELHFRAMNTGVGIWVWSANRERETIVRSSLRRARDVFAEVEGELSRFRASSALSRLNRAAGSGPQALSPLFWTVLMSALEAARASGGLYDPTVCRTMERLGYDRSFDAVESNGTALPDSPVQAFGSWQRVRADCVARSVSLPADLALDLGGIAKGWTVDHVMPALARLGPALVDAGGDLRVVGTIGDDGWPIGVQDPFDPARDRRVVYLRGGALATSSIGGRCWQRGGRLLHHVIDPRTGTSAQSDLHSVTVYAPKAMTADVAAKVTLISGSGAGAAYLLKHRLAALLTTTDGRHHVVGDFPRGEEAGRHASVHGT